MVNGTLYMKFGSDPDYFEVSILPLSELSENHIDEQPNTRMDWGEIKIKNKPYNYGLSAINRYKLYDLIMQQLPTSEIRIKFVSAEYPEPGIEGYFGIIDCDVDNDSGLITIKPTILDQYTPILENRETEVKLFEDHNIVRNPMFATVTNLIPDNWAVSSVGFLKLERIWLDNNTAVKVSDDYFVYTEPINKIGYWDAGLNSPNLNGLVSTNGYYYECNVAGDYTNAWRTWGYEVGDKVIYNAEYNIWIPQQGMARLFPTDPISFSQTTPSVLKSKQLKFSFNYFLSGSSSRQKKLDFDVLLTDPITSDVYRLQSNGKWVPKIIMVINYPVNYDTIPISVELGSFSQYRKKIYFTEPTPVAGTVEIVFYRPSDTQEWDASSSLVITDVEFSASDIVLKTIKVNFSEENIIHAFQGENPIYWSGKSTNRDDDIFYKYGLNYAGDDEEFDNFIDPISGIPIQGMLSNADESPTSTKNITYGDLLTIFDSNRLQPSYKFEMSELTIFKGEAKGNHRYWYAIAEFSREEIIKKDPIGWVVGDGYSEDILPPPELGVGWAYTDTFIPDGSTNRLWVRKPFNGQPTTWTLGAINRSSGSRRSYNGRFEYWDSLTTKKNYPISSSKSFTVESAIDLRELIRKVYCESSPELIGKNVYSTFFWNDEDSGGVIANPTIQGLLNLSGTNTGSNYVTMTDSSKDLEPVNPLKNIAAIHTYELLSAADQKYGDEKSILKISFKKLIEDLQVLFHQQLFFFVDSSYNLYIEHVKYFDRTNTPKNLTEPQFAYIRNYESWKYDKSKMYSLEEFEVKNAGYVDFKTSKIVFDKMPSNKRGEDLKASYATQNLTTDIQFCKENPTSIDNGIILVCYDVVGTDNIVRYGTGQKSGHSVINGDLSISSLVSKYGTYEGTWLKGIINDKGSNENEKYYDFRFTKRSKEGKEITVKGILTNDLVITNLGRGLVKSKVIDYNNQLTKIVVNYRYNDYNNGLDFGDQEQIFSLPSVLTMGTAVIISNTEVDCIGQLVSNGGTPVTENGICYSTSPLAVSTADTKVIGVESVGYFTSSLTGLTAGTKYYFRAYAINSVGTSYGVIDSFIIALPVITTVGTTNITSMTATIDSEVIAIGLSAVTARGVCWSSVTVPDITDSKTVDGSGIGTFTSSLTGLTPLTWYNARAYATNSSGTAYSRKIRFKTLIEV